MASELQSSLPWTERTVSEAEKHGSHVGARRTFPRTGLAPLDGQLSFSEANDYQPIKNTSKNRPSL